MAARRDVAGADARRPMRCGATPPNALTDRAAVSDKRNKLCLGSDLTTRPKNCHFGR